MKPEEKKRLLAEMERDAYDFEKELSEIGDLGVIALTLVVIAITLGAWVAHPILGIVVTVCGAVPTLMAFGPGGSAYTQRKERKR